MQTIIEEKPQRVYGWKRDRMNEKFKYLKITPKPIQKTYPPVLVLSYMPPVYNQGELGSCTANALAAAFEYDQQKQNLVNFVPSRLFIYYGERSIENTVATDSGAAISDGIRVLNTWGVCPETMWPYNIAEFAVKPPAIAYTDALPNKAISDYRINPSPMDFKTIINLGYPVVFGFTVYESFESIGPNGIMPIPNPNEQILGGHAVVACGYNDTMSFNGVTGFIRVRNSWGPSWADEGYFYMPYAFLTSANVNDCWVITKDTGIATKLKEHLELGTGIIRTITRTITKIKSHIKVKTFSIQVQVQVPYLV